jgi:hypothetical protein
MLFASLIANPPELHFGHGVLCGDLECLQYVMVDMHELSPQIDEVMEFRRRLNIKQILENLYLEIGLHSSVWTLETNSSRPQYFFKISTLVVQVMRNNFYFGSVV